MIIITREAENMTSCVTAAREFQVSTSHLPVWIAGEKKIQSNK
jgi:hypothetical protein